MSKLTESERTELLTYLCDNDQWVYEKNLHLLPNNLQKLARF